MSATEPNAFLKISRSFSEIKRELFGAYFENWCDIKYSALKAAADKTVCLVDMQAGQEQSIEEKPGNEVYSYSYLYKTIAKKPTPVQSYIYDKDKVGLEQASELLLELAQEQELTHQPVALQNAENKAQLAEELSTGKPALVFMDPFQNAYAQQVLWQSVMKWRSDLFMLLRPDNITKALATKKVSQPLTDLLGDNLEGIGTYCRKEKNKYKCQRYILDKFIRSLQQKGNLTLLYKVNLPDTEQPEHYIIFASPDMLAYKTFKEILLPYATYARDGVPVFRANDFRQLQTTLFEKRPVYTIANLTDRLMAQADVYKYKSIDKIYTMDNGNTNYSRDNYMVAFEHLRNEGKVTFLNASTMQTIRKPTPTSVVKFL